jgi:Mn-dependent DtxR family transcriptional regulator
MIVDNTGKYAETTEELWRDLGQDEITSLPQFNRTVKGLVEKGLIDYVKGKGYKLNDQVIKEIEKSMGIKVDSNELYSL